MLKFESLLKEMQKYTSYDDNAAFMGNLANIVENPKYQFSSEDWNYLVNFLIKEMQKLSEIIPRENVYKERFEMLNYCNELVYTFRAIIKRKVPIDQNLTDIEKKFEEFFHDTFAFELFMEKTICSIPVKKEPLDKIIENVKAANDEFQRSVFYLMLERQKQNFKNYSTEARKSLTAFLEEDIERLLTVTDNKDALTSLEYAADICNYFMNDRLTELLQRIIEIPDTNVQFFALTTLINYGNPVNKEYIKSVAEDLFFAESLYLNLEKAGKLDLFPAELRTPEYIAKSNMAHWLAHPNEINEIPKEITFIGKVEDEYENYYVFKFKTDSKNLPENLRNFDLIGWAGDEGNTFSEFKKFSDYDKGKPEKTLKYIKKKIFR